MWILYTVIALILYGIAEYGAKLYANGGSLRLLLIALAFYMGCTLLWFPALKDNNQLGVMTVTWSLLYVIIGLAMSAIFKEHLSPTQWIGCGMAVASIVLLHWKG